MDFYLQSPCNTNVVCGLCEHMLLIQSRCHLRQHLMLSLPLGWFVYLLIRVNHDGMCEIASKCLFCMFRIIVRQCSEFNISVPTMQYIVTHCSALCCPKIASATLQSTKVHWHWAIGERGEPHRQFPWACPQLAMTRPHLLPLAQSEPEIGFMGGSGRQSVTGYYHKTA